MGKVTRYLLVGLFTVIFSVLINYIEPFSSFNNSNLYNALAVGILTMIFAFVILRGINNKNE